MGTIMASHAFQKMLWTGSKFRLVSQLLKVLVTYCSLQILFRNLCNYQKNANTMEIKRRVFAVKHKIQECLMPQVPRERLAGLLQAVMTAMISLDR